MTAQMADAHDVERRRAERLVAAKRAQDLVFGALGIVVLFVVMGLLLTLIADLMVDGLGRIDPEFLTSFPSRRAGAAG